MAGVLSNTGRTTVTDRQTQGPIPDTSPPNGSTPSGAPGGGTVTSVGTGAGLTGGPITGVGTIALAPIADASTLGNVSGGVAIPVPVTVSQLLDKAIGTARGDIIFRNATTWVSLAPGTAGQVLKTGGAGADPSWGSGGGSGTVTSVGVSGANGIGVAGSPITGAGTIALTLGDVSSATSKPGAAGSVVRSFASRDADVFNVKDYGALGDDSTNDTAAINAAFAAAAAVGSGSIYFPDGKYKILSAVGFAAATAGKYAVFGDGPGVSVISQHTAATDALYLNFGTVSDRQENIADVHDLGFTVPNGITGARALTIDYGSNFQNSIGLGSAARGIMITHDPGGGGYTSGVNFLHGWFNRVEHVFGWGSAATYDSGSGGGSGAFIYFNEGTNSQISHVYGNYFYNLIKVIASGGSDVFQGLLLSNLHGVQCPIMIDLVGQAACGAIDITNCQLDNGNLAGQSRATFLRADTVNEIAINNVHSINNATSGNSKPLEVTTCNGLYATNVQIFTGSAGTLTGFKLASVTRGAITGCSFSGFTAGKDVTMDAGTSWVRVRDCVGTSGLALCTDLGTHNFHDIAASATWDPANLVPGAQDFKNITATGAAFGQGWIVGVPYDLQNMMANVIVMAADTVRINVFNSNSGSTVDLGSGTWTVTRVS